MQSTASRRAAALRCPRAAALAIARRAGERASGAALENARHEARRGPPDDSQRHEWPEPPLRRYPANNRKSAARAVLGCDHGSVEELGEPRNGMEFRQLGLAP